MNKRALLICRYDYWPELTPDRIWELPYEMWGPLALACDSITAKREQAAAELESKRR